MNPTYNQLLSALDQSISNLGDLEEGLSGDGFPLMVALWQSYRSQLVALESRFGPTEYRPAVASLMAGIGFCLAASRVDPITEDEISLNELIQASSYVEIALAQLA